MASSSVPSVVQSSPTTPLTPSSNSQPLLNQIPNLPPHPPSNNDDNNSLNSKKRPLDHLYLLQNSPYFKIRAILQDLRPLFLQVLGSPEFQSCEAAHRIQEKLKIMVDLCRLHSEVPLVKCKNEADFTSEKQGGQPSQVKRFPVGNNLEKPTHGSNRISGTYIVGGSAFGWNFITFHGTKPEYYGRTKESFRAGK